MPILPIAGLPPFALRPARLVPARASLENVPSPEKEFALVTRGLDLPTPIDSELRLNRALWQHNVLGQTSIRLEHVGILFVFGQYCAKAAELPAALGGYWLSPDSATLAELKKSLWLNEPLGLRSLNIYAFPWMQAPARLGPPAAAFAAAHAPAPVEQHEKMNLVA